ncbi:hypothetical protein B5P45_03460 [Phyllobacterium zundukense]|uniref:Uncharacterized protein n=1 Tax=Phyllobacterium zundukense TaxID=1867719 RepID=A0A2N9W363_9HYPH|nr:hypothetical protein BLM14_21850 [Phyllobacterium zundukense]PIO46181.1 hypothetical protein B5P45_03460 [Phyllobacterium zundukense]
MEKAPAGLFEHYCMHEGCKSWGAFGFEKRYGQEWYCSEHKNDAGDSQRKPGLANCSTGQKH